MAANYRKSNTVPAQSGSVYRKSNTIAATSGLVYRKFNTITPATEVISDIDNDFRFVKNYALDDFNNDFRMISSLARLDFNNDFRLTGITLDNIDNDFRMVGNIVKIDIDNDFRSRLEALYNINNKINTVKLELKDIGNKFNSVIEVESDVMNLFNLVNGIDNDIDNDIRTHKLEINNINNDFRLIADWQIPGTAGFQSLGKTYVKVYINSVLQTDADIDSISITKIINGAHTATFELGRAYDSTKPDMQATVEIKYNDWVIYKGYITDIIPANNPESIRINCQDKYWKQNKTNKYFFVGHQPQDEQEKYYDTIQDALSSEHSWSVDLGNFIPQTINLFGRGESDSISELLQNAGNYGWFYKEDESKKLWVAGQGDIVNIEAQTIGENLGLYQTIRHQFRESIEGIVNKLRVQMGEKVVRKFDINGGTKNYAGYNYKYVDIYPTPMWSSFNEITAKESSSGYGWDYHLPEDAYKYKDVFVRYRLPYLNSELESWTDRYPPVLHIEHPYFGWTAFTLEGYNPIYGTTPKIGFTIDYENHELVLNSPFLFYTGDFESPTSIRRPNLRLEMWKKNYYSFTTTPSEDPESEESNPLLFFTDKMGTYSETIIGVLDLSSLSVQEGVTYIKPNHIVPQDEWETITIPSWDDTDFAEDFANWQLTRTADKKVEGSIDITLDALMFYDIDLSKRIMIDGVIDNALNINSITINISNFTASINLENKRTYKRTVSLQTHGE